MTNVRNALEQNKWRPKKRSSPKLEEFLFPKSTEDQKKTKKTPKMIQAQVPIIAGNKVSNVTELKNFTILC